MTFTEKALVIPCGADQLVGIVTRPERPASLGLVVVVGGPQYRVGSHRQFVLLARCLASAGYAVLRFDYRGMGDSSGETRNFDNVQEDIAQAMDALQAQCPEVKRIVLWGLCDGASAVLLQASKSVDARTVGLCLLNPWVRSEATLARTHLKHYYLARVVQVDFWRQLLRGEFAWRQALQGFWGNLTARRASTQSGLVQDAPFQRRMAQALRAFKGQVLLILSTNDYTAKEFLECAKSDPDWRGLLGLPSLRRVDVAGADHTFSQAEWRASTEQSLLNWMDVLKASP